MAVLSDTCVLAFVLWQCTLDCELGQAILKGRVGMRHWLVWRGSGGRKKGKCVTLGEETPKPSPHTSKKKVSYTKSVKVKESSITRRETIEERLLEIKQETNIHSFTLNKENVGCGIAHKTNKCVVAEKDCTNVKK